MVVGIAILCVVNQRSGHDWGDDFALYIRQGKSIVDGNVHQVLDDNKFTVANSSWHTFSPNSYPWGWPLLIAPLYAIWGLDFAVLKQFEAVLFAVFLFTWFRVVARRSTERAALLLVLMLGMSVAYVGWTDTALSEFPYLAFLGITLWWIDRCRTRGAFETGRLWPLALAGVLAAYTYSIRREGMALFAAIGMVHLAALVRSAATERSVVRVLKTAPWKRIATPYAAGVGFVVGLQLLLPSVLFQRYPDAGLKQMKPNIIWFRDILAEQIGLKDQGADHFDLLGSDGLAKFVLGVFVTLAVLGLVMRIATALETDAPIIGYTVLVVLIIGVQPFHEGRYLMSITPMMAYFAYQAIAVGVRIRRGWRGDTGRNVGRVLAGLFIGLFVVANATDLYRRTQTRIDTGDYIVWGPEDPAARALFAEIRAHTEPDAVIGFFRARAMNLYSDHRSVQVTTLDDVLADSDYYAMEKNSDYSQVLLLDSDAEAAGMQKVWENDHFILWKVNRT